MTREEKLQKAHQMFNKRNLLLELKWQREYFKSGYVSNQEELFNLWIFDECIKALEQEPCEYYDADNKTCRRSEVPKEPCEDCISRKAVINITAETGALETQWRVKELPSVTPQPKMGHWIFKNDNVAIPTGYFQCSECNSGKLLHVDNYCPSCGAQMESVERAESED